MPRTEQAREADVVLFLFLARECLFVSNDGGFLGVVYCSSVDCFFHRILAAFLFLESFFIGLYSERRGSCTQQNKQESFDHVQYPQLVTISSSSYWGVSG